MNYDPAIHHRRSIRLKNYDYAAAGAYFVTVCVQGRTCLFGEIMNGAMVMNEAGRMDVVHRFKSLATARCRHGVNQCNWP